MSPKNKVMEHPARAFTQRMQAVNKGNLKKQGKRASAKASAKAKAKGKAKTTKVTNLKLGRLGQMSLDDKMAKLQGVAEQQVQLLGRGRGRV